MTHANDTIAATSTPPGRGGIGIVRLSGPDAKAIVEGMVRLRRPLAPGRARFAEVLEAGTETVLDQAVITWFAAPNSYTSEDVVEIAAHGSPVLLDAILRQCLQAGARLAEPGEFTERAFLSGRLDLTQAEAVQGLIDATTLQQARTAARQMGGALSRKIAPVKQELIHLIAALEAGIDFAEDDLDLMEDTAIARQLNAIAEPLMQLEKSFAYGQVLRDGFRLAVVGRPNAGKSSLFNRLVGHERAIVTAQAGTTRDTVSERVDVGGIPVELVDTAGLRIELAEGGALDEAELIGVARSREAMADADVLLLVVAADTVEDGVLHGEDQAVIDAAAGRRLIVALNKIDLVGDQAVPAEVEAKIISTSALNDIGVGALRQAVLEDLKAPSGTGESITVTSARQQGAIAEALKAMHSAQDGLANKMPHEMLLLDLHEALAALDRLTGTTHTEDILGVIFGSFCIGK
jgi:tRNA modification GTPase